MKPIPIPLERQKQQKKAVRLLPWSLLAPSGTCYAPGSLLSRNLQQREGEESGFSVNHNPFFSPSAFRKWINIPQGKPGCFFLKKKNVCGESPTSEFAGWVTLFPSAAGMTRLLRTEQKGRLPCQPGKQKDFPTSGLARLGSWGGADGDAGKFQQARTKPVAIYLSLKKAGNILKLNKQLWVSFSY